MRLWRAIYWVTGLFAVTSAAVAGFGGLTDLLGQEIAGGLALLAAAAAVTEKYLAAGEKTGMLQRRCDLLNSVGYQVKVDIADGTNRRRAEPSYEFEQWLEAQCQIIDKSVGKINTETSEV